MQEEVGQQKAVVGKNVLLIAAVVVKLLPTTDGLLRAAARVGGVN